MTNKYILFPAIAFALASCSQTDEPGMLSEPKQADFFAQIGETNSRASGTQWDAGDVIGISGVSGSKTYSNVKFITTSGDGNFAAEGDKIFYQTTDPVTFTAYYPYADNLADDGIISASASDQTNQPSFDFLWAQSTGSYSAPAVNFSFSHCMSKINIAFTNGNDVDLSDMKFSIEGLVLDGTFNTATGEAKIAENGTPSSLTASLSTDSKASLIVFPQSADNLSVKVIAEGQQYSCALSPGVLTSGNAYTFDITVSKTGLAVSDCSITTWGDGGTFNGEASISEPKLKVGDFFYSDGTYSSELVPSKTCIGIVFFVGQHPDDQSDYSFSGIREVMCHGYVVALTDVHNGESDRLRWEYGPNGEYDISVRTSTSADDWNGYDNCTRIQECVDYDHKEDGWEMKHFPAAYACETYGTRTLDRDGVLSTAYSWQKPLTAPDNTSGWFLPSCGQLKHIYQNSALLSSRMSEVKSNVSNECSYKDYIKWFDTSMSYYWSSTQYFDSEDEACYIDVSSGNTSHETKRFYGAARAIFAF